MDLLSKTTPASSLTVRTVALWAMLVTTVTSLLLATSIATLTLIAAIIVDIMAHDVFYSHARLWFRCWHLNVDLLGLNRLFG